MMGLLAAFGALRVTGANLFRKKITEALPWEGGRKHPDRYRTSFALVHNEDGDEACIGCKMCEKICPSQIISVAAGGRSAAPKSGKMRGTAKEFTLDLNACIHCELCVQVCPEDAILMLKVPQTPGYSREELFLSMEKLYANEPVEKSWGTGALLVAMQEPAAAAKPPAKPAPKPAEAPKAEAPKAEPVKAEAPKAEPAAETPKAEPAVEAPKPEAPKAEPAVEAPKADAPQPADVAAPPAAEPPHIEVQASVAAAVADAPHIEVVEAPLAPAALPPAPPTEANPFDAPEPTVVHPTRGGGS